MNKVKKRSSSAGRAECLASKPAVAPSMPATRIAQLDVLRGFAVLGIFYINIVYFGLPYGSTDMPLLFGVSDQLNQFAWLIGSQFVEGSMFGLFSLLFGASALLILDESRLNGPGGVAQVEKYYRRTLWLVAFGLFHAFVLLSPLEILFTYGVLGLALFPFRRLHPLPLLLLGLLLMAGGMPGLGEDGSEGDSTSISLNGMDEYNIERFVIENPDKNQKQIQQAFRETMLEEMQGDRVLYKSGYKEIFSSNIEMAIHQQTHNLYRDNLFDAGGMMLVGMALFKWGVLSGARSAGFYLLMLLVGYGVALMMRMPIIYDALIQGFPPKVMLELSSGRHFFARVPLAMGHIGLIMLLCRMPWLNWLSKGLAAVGRMALTNYMAQTLFSICLFFGFGMALFAELERYQIALTAVLFGVTQIIYSLMWLKQFRYGPVEWLWRSLVNGRLEPFVVDRPPQRPPQPDPLPG